MNPASRKVRNVYLMLMLLHTLAASFIWGINTLFLLDAGLSNTEAFAANAFFTAGMVIFEVPTGVVADTRGRRTSYLLGTVTLAVSTLCYLWMWRVTGPFWAWALASIALGLGFTFFSGAVEAWLVDALTESGYLREGGTLESILAQGEIVEGVAMLGGSIAGGVIAQATNLGVPYILRAVALVLSFICAFLLMQDTGFTPKHDKRTIDEVRGVLRCAIEHGLAHPPIRSMMLAAPFIGGVSIYAFYAMQPYLLEMYGDSRAYAVAGLAAAIVAGAQIVGGILVPHIGRLFTRRTSVILLATALGALILGLIGLAHGFWWVTTLLALWGVLFAALTPVRQAYLNGLIAAEQRATVLSFDSLLSSTGGAILQPVLGKTADIWSYSTSYVVCAALQSLAIPFVWLARRERPRSDTFEH
jgi:MFS family permease